MKKYLLSLQNYCKKLFANEATIGVLVTLGVMAIVVIIVLLIQAAQPKIVYQPDIACDMFTQDEAKEMLGDTVLHQTPASPTLQSGIATSKCSYTNQNPDQDQMLVAAVAVRSAVDDSGTDKNTATFHVAATAKEVQAVNGIAQRAFFNSKLGQLNILSGRNWIIVSYGVGADPRSNTLDRAIELAQKVIADPTLPTF